VLAVGYSGPVAVVAVSPVSALRREIESIAQDVATPTDERVADLRRMRDALEVTLGACDTYIDALGKHQEGEAAQHAQAVQEFRDSHLIRDELLREGIATPEQCDEAGFLPAEEIAKLEEEGLLEAVAVDWTARLHPRNRRGEFRDTPDVPRMLVDRGARSTLERARDRAHDVTVKRSDGSMVSGGVRSVGPTGATVEDSDGEGHRIRWEQMDYVQDNTAGTGPVGHVDQPVAPVAREPLPAKHESETRPLFERAREQGHRVDVLTVGGDAFLNAGVVDVEDNAVNLQDAEGVQRHLYWEDVADASDVDAGGARSGPMGGQGAPMLDVAANPTPEQFRVLAERAKVARRPLIFQIGQSVNNDPVLVTRVTGENFDYRPYNQGSPGGGNMPFDSALPVTRVRLGDGWDAPQGDVRKASTLGTPDEIDELLRDANGPTRPRVGLNLGGGEGIRDVRVIGLDPERPPGGGILIEYDDGMRRTIRREDVFQGSTGDYDHDAKVRARVRDRRRADAERERADAEAKRFDQWKETSDAVPDLWQPPEGVTYSPEVQAINTPEDAESYLATRGIEAQLTPEDTEQGRNIRKDADFFREIAQAVTDAQDRYPVLKDGPVPLKHIALWNHIKGSIPVHGDDKDGVWGVTSTNFDDGTNPKWMPFAPDGNPKNTWIGLNDRNQFGFQVRHDTSALMGMMGWAGQSPYGRMMHELGHATYSAAGLSQADHDSADEAEAKGEDDFDAVDIDVFMDANFTPRDMASISEYGLSSSAEAFAEMYATLNVPGALDTIPVSVRRRLERAQKVAPEHTGGVRIL
jgi:hypothetical protein